MQYKKCSKCGEVKPITEFNKAKREKFGVSHRCKACTKLYNRQYYKENQDKILDQHRDYYKENKEYKLDYQHEYYADHKEEYAKKREERKDEIKKYHKEYQKRKPAAYVASHAKRHASKLNQTPPDADFSLIEKFYTLAKIMEEETGQKYHVDHIVPLSKYGQHHEDNLQVILATVNLSKFNKMIKVPGIRKHDILNNPVIIEQLKQYKEKRQS